MNETANQLSNLALLVSKTSSAVNTLEEIIEILNDAEENGMSAEEVLDEINEIVTHYEALETFANLTPEEVNEMLADIEDDEEDNEPPPPPTRKLKSYPRGGS